MKRRTRIIIMAGAGLAAVVTALFIGLLVAASGPASKYILSRTGRALGEYLGAQVDIGSFSLLPPTVVTVRDVVVRFPPPESDSVTIRRLTVNFDASDLFFRTVSFESINVHDASIDVTRREDGTVPAFGFLMRPAGPPATFWKIYVGPIALRKLRLGYADRNAGFRARTGRATITVRLDPGGVVAADAVLEHNSFLSERYGDTVPVVRADVIIDSSGIRIRRGMVGGDSLLQANVEGFLPFTAAGGMDIKISGTMRPQDRLGKLVPGMPARFGAPVSFELLGRGSFAAPDLSVRMDGEAAGVGGYRLKGVTLAAVLADSLRLDVGTIVNGAAAKLSVTGDVSALFDRNRDRPLALAGRIAVDRLAPVLPALPTWLDPPAGAAAIDCRAVIDPVTLRPDTVDAAVTVSGGRAGGAVRAAAGLRNEKIAGTVVYGADTIRLTGRFDRELNYRLAVDGVVGELLSFINLRQGSVPRGAVALRGSVDGGKNGVGRFTAAAESDMLAWNGLEVRQLRAECRGTAKNFEIVDARAQVSGDVGRAARWFGADSVGGVVDAAVAFSGAPQRWHGSAGVRAVRPSYGAVALDSMVGSVQYDSGAVNVENVSLHRGAVAAQVNGTVGIGRQSTGSLRTALFCDGENAGSVAVEFALAADSMRAVAELARVDPVLASAYKAGIRAAGSVDGRITAGGRYRNPRIDASLSATGLALNGVAVGSAALDAGMADSALTGRMQVRLAGGANAAAEWGLFLQPGHGWRFDAGRRSHAELQTDTVGIAILRPFLPESLSLGGKIRVDARAFHENSGWALDGRAFLLNGSAGWRPLSVSVDGIAGSVAATGTFTNPAVTFDLLTGPIVRAGTSGGRFDRSEWAGRADRSELVLEKGMVTAGGGSALFSGMVRYVLEAPARIVMPASVIYDVRDIDLTAVNPFLAGVVFTGGVAYGKGAVTVDASSVSLDGSFSADSVVAAIDGLEPPVGPVGVSVSLSGDSATIRRAEGRWGRGALGLSGSAVWSPSGLDKAELRLSAKDNSFTWGKTATVTLNRVELTLGGSMPSLMLSGAVDVEKALYDQEIRLVDLIDMVRPKPEPPGAARKRSILDGIALDLSLTSGAAVVADLGMARVRSRLNLAVRGTAAQPFPAGDIIIADGHVYYLDRKFQVTQGSFRQIGEGRYNPDLDLAAQSRVTAGAGVQASENYTVILAVSGTLDEPEVSLRSDPPLSQVDIISLLTIGRVRNSRGEVLAIESGNARGMLVDRTSSIASNQIIGLASRRIERLFDLENFNIDGNVFEIGREWNPTITVTKRVFDPLSVTYQGVVGQSSLQRIKVSYRLMPWLYLDGETDRQGNAGLDFKAKWSF